MSLVCGQCGYDVRGLPSAICPECGADLAVVGLRDRAIIATLIYTAAPLFRTARGRTGTLTGRAISGKDICYMVKRRFKAAGYGDKFTPHTFRATTATDLLEQDVDLKDVQTLLGHADPRTTRLYDHTGKKVTRNIVERISV